MDDAAKAEKLLRNLARRLNADWEGVAGSILEGLDEMLTVTRLGLPRELIGATVFLASDASSRTQRPRPPETGRIDR